MPQASETYHFHSPGIFAGQTGIIDSDNFIIRGVSVITGGIEAEGHNLQVDDTTLKQLQACAKEKGKIPVTLDHGSGVKDLNGYICGFRMDGDKLRGDWHLLKTHDESIKMLERAEVMPECFGLSVAFKGPRDGVPTGGGKMAARCEKLLSVDVVTRPAANATGLFGADPVDKPNNDMPKQTQNTDPGAAAPANTEPTMQDVMARLEEISGRLEQHESFLNENFNQEPTLEDLHNATDEQLEQVGLTRAEVNAAVAEATRGMEQNQNPDASQTQNPSSEEGKTAGAAMAGAAATSGADVSAPATFEQLSKAVVQLQAKLTSKENAEKQEKANIEFKTVEDKIIKLDGVLKDAIKKNVELEAKNKALEIALRTGTKPVSAGVDTGMRLFGVKESSNGLHAFQARVKELVATKTCKSDGEAIIFAQKENPALHADWVQSLSGDTKLEIED